MSTKTPHPHAQFIKAWADGAQIQYFNGTNWVDIPRNEPYWTKSVKYRIAPEPKKYRVVLIKTPLQSWTTTIDDPACEKQFERTESFSRWLTPWTEYTPDDPQAHPQDYPVPPGHVRGPG